ncbi:MFS general substrate transporter [Ramaria rubella]|nr:MFS general substrate transporter [Ramaria rubella]
MSEATPLLSDSVDNRSQDVYDRFSPVQKKFILSILAMAGIISPFASGCFVPCVPEIAKDLNTSGSVINYTVAAYVFTIALGNLIWAPYAGFYGRRPVYLVSLPLLCLGSLAAAISKNVLQLVISRALQAFGASCVTSVGAATISDIYKLEERGTAMGVLLGTVLFGPALAPLLGGLTATYASWRIMQLIIFSMGLAALVFVAAFLPETSHPGSRGIDKLRAGETDTASASSGKKQTWVWVWLNPFNPLGLLRGPNISLVVIASAMTLVTDYVLLIPLSYTIGSSYHIESPALVGACFLVSGIGNIVGAPVAGHFSDRAVINGRKRRGGEWVPEDRLTAALPGAMVMVPFFVLVYGLTTQFVPGRLGLVIDLICLFIHGVGIVGVLSPCSTYIADIVHSRSAEALAVSYFVRNLFCSLASAVVLPTIDKIGVAATNGLAAVVGWLALGLLLATIHYGDKLRAWVDIGYTSSLQDS